MIDGRWGTSSRTLLDLTVDERGVVTGVVNPDAEHGAIRRGTFDRATRTVHLEGDYEEPGAPPTPFAIDGTLVDRTLVLTYRFGDLTGNVSIVRVEEYRLPPLTLRQRLEPFAAGIVRRLAALTRPSGRANARKLRERGETLHSIVFRDATAADIPALAELHVTTWNATYNTTRGPTIALRTRQWEEVFARQDPRAFVLVVENVEGRLIGFAFGRPHRGYPGFTGELSKIYLRWEYHGLGLGRAMMGHVARRFLARKIESFCLFAELRNPTLGFYDRLGGERLHDEHGRFTGAFGWRNLSALAELPGR